MARPHVLLTGFGPFPGVADNPSAWLAETLAEQRPAPEFKLHARVLPTEWKAAARLPRLYQSLQPHVMIHFGLSEHAAAFRIERSAHNRVAQRADARGALPKSHAIRARRTRSFRYAVSGGRSCRASQAKRSCRRNVAVGRGLCLQLSLLPFARLGAQAEKCPACPLRPRSALDQEARSLQSRGPLARRGRDLALCLALRKRPGTV